MILSSHLVADLERICDYLVLLHHGSLALSGDLDDLLMTHRLLTAPRRSIRLLERDHTVLRCEETSRHTSVWIRLSGPLTDPDWQVEELGLEEIVLAYMGRDRCTSDPANVGIPSIPGIAR